MSRKSTSGVIARVGGHTLKSSSTLQSLTALSVGEAEFLALVKGAAVGLMMKAVYADLGLDMWVNVQSDSSTAGALTDRLGAGPRTKHLDTRFMWVQERVQDEELKVTKVHTDLNVSDVCTKPTSSATLDKHCKSAGMIFL